MIVPSKAIDKQSLKGLNPLCKLTPDKIDDIISKSQVTNLPAGRIIFRQGEKNGQTIYLLSGQIELSTAGKSRKELIKGKSAEAKFPIADQIPRHATARTKTASTLLYIDSSLLEILLNENPSGEYEVTELDVTDNETDWMMRFLQSPAFRKLPTKNIQKILMNMEEIHVEKDETIIQQTSKGDYYYIIRHGSCCVTRQPTEKSNEVNLTKLFEGDGFGEEALIANCKRNATVRMREKGTLMRLKRDDFLSLLVTPLIRNIHLNSLKSELYKNSIFLDIRTNEEFKQGSLDRAQNIPLSMMRLRVPTLNAHKQYLIYSENKDEANSAAFLLAQHGIDCLVVLGTLGKIIPITESITEKKKPEPHSENTTAPDLNQTAENKSNYPAKKDPPVKQENKITDTLNNTPEELSMKVSISESQKITNAQEIENLQIQAKQDVAKLLADAKAIQQSAVQDAYRLRNKIEKEATIKLRAELEDTRNQAKSALQKSEQLAEQIRQQAEKESSQIRQQALSEANKLREELNRLREQEVQIKQQWNTELSEIKQKSAEQVRIETERVTEEAQINAEKVRNNALRDAEATLATAQQAVLAAENAQSIATTKAEKTRIEAEKAAAKAKAITVRLTIQALAIEKQTAQKARAVRQAAQEEADRIKSHAIEESKKITQSTIAEKKSIISHENVFNLEEELSPTIKPTQPYADEASMALKMAKEVKARLIEVEEQRLKDEQDRIRKLNQKKVQIKKLDGEIIIEDEKDIFIFREPKKQNKEIKHNAEVTPVEYTPNELPTSPSHSPIDIEDFDLPAIHTENHYLNEKPKKNFLVLIVSICVFILLIFLAYMTITPFNFSEIESFIKQDSHKVEETIKPPKQKP